MQYFDNISSWPTAADFQAIKAEALSHEDLWLADQSRQKMARPQQHTQTIFLRSPVIDQEKSADFWDIMESQETDYATRFPKAMDMLYKFAELQNADLCRVLYVKLLPQSVVYRHYDNGSYFLERDRYHLVVSSQGGSFLSAGDETVTMQEGELWWFDNKALHDSKNPTDLDRIHLIFDLLPRKRRLFAPETTPESSFEHYERQSH